MQAPKSTSDVLPPVTSIQIEGNGPGAGVYYGPVQVSLSATDDSSGIQYTEYSTDGGLSWNRYESTITLLDPKVYSFKYRSVDNAGNIEAVKTNKITIKADTFPPTTTLSLSGTVGGNSYYVSQVQVSLTAKDDYSGVKQSEYSLDDGVNWIIYEGSFTLETSGVNRVSYRSIDRNNNVEAFKSQKVLIDLIPPSAPQITANPVGWTNEDVSVTVTSSLDGGSGSMKSQYKIGETGSWLDYSAPFTVTGETEMKVYARTIDYAGNLGEITEYGLQFDKVPPESPQIILSQADWTFTDVYATFVDGNDAASGVGYSEYNWTDDWMRYQSSLLIKEEGLTTILGRSVDRAGNYSPEVSAIAKIDKTKPAAPSLILSTDDWTNEDVQLTMLHGADELSGVQRSEAASNPNGDPLYQEYTGAVVISNNVPYYVYGRTIDRAGNVSEAASLLVKIDKVAPSIPILEASTTEWTRDDVLIHVTSGTDEHSGVKEVQVKVTDAGQWMPFEEEFPVTQEGIHTVYARTVDHAGNHSATASVVVKIDRTPPTAPGLVFVPAKTASSVMLAWEPATDNASGVAGYEIYNGEALLGSTEGTSITLTGLTANTPYNLIVRTKDAAGNISPASEAVRVVLTDPLISALRSHYAIKGDGNVWAWGKNTYGELGSGSQIDSFTPVAAHPLQGFVHVSSGAEYAAGVKNDGTVWAWGSNLTGNLGPDASISLTPVQIPNLDSIMSVQAGLTHTFALKNDGTLWGWGSNGVGQLGFGNKSAPVASPIQVPQMEAVVGVSASYYHSLALKQDGTVWAWGDNSNGQLGDGTLVEKLSPQQVPGLGSIIAISAGPYLNLALKQDGTVWTWGNVNLGPLGDGNDTGSSVPVQVAGLSGIISVEAGNGFGMALRNDGTVWTWGYNSGQLGEGTTQTALFPVQVSHLSGVAEIVAAEDSVFAVKENGSVWVWGNNWYGGLGNGNHLGDMTTTRIPLSGIPGGTADSTPPSAPELSVTGVASNSTVLSWSEPLDDFAVKDYDIYQNGVWIGSTAVSGKTSQQARTFTATALNTETAYTFTVRAKDYSGNQSPFSNEVTITTEASLPNSISAAVNRSLILKSDGTVWQTGERPESPTQVPELHSIVAISQGKDHALALRSDGTVWAWGRNDNGQLGVLDTYYALVPVQVSNLSQVVSVAAGERHSLALKSDGTMWAWGGNYPGVLGLGDPNLYVQQIPAQIPGLTNVKEISAGLLNSAAVQQDGTLWVWGSNFYGQIGDGTLTNRYAPVRVYGLTGATDIAFGLYHSLAARADGTVWAWGANYNGQLGDGTTIDHIVPMKVNGLEGITGVAAGWIHSLAVSSNESVWSWGDNYLGQLGDGTPISKLSPIRISSLSGQVEVAAGSYHSLSLAANGTVWGWGQNDSFQLADGTWYTRQTPVPMHGLTSQQGRRDFGEAPAESEIVRTAEDIESYRQQVEAYRREIPDMDIFAPHAPVITGIEKVAGGIKLSWSQPEDNVQVVRYIIRSGNQVVAETEDLQWTFDKVAGEASMITISAMDAAGNESMMSRAVIIGE
jgi:alpha-tubulin suppressor-like RCC1 family protein